MMLKTICWLREREREREREIRQFVNFMHAVPF